MDVINEYWILRVDGKQKQTYFVHNTAVIQKEVRLPLVGVDANVVSVSKIKTIINLWMNQIKK